MFQFEHTAQQLCKARDHMDFSQGLLDRTEAPYICISKCSCLHMFYRGKSSEKFWEIHRKTPVPELLCNQVPALQRATLFILKKRLRQKNLPVNFAKILYAPFLYNTSGRLHKHRLFC